MWQTPKASEEESGSGMNSRGEPKLKAQANNWLTPHGMSGMDSTGKVGAGGEFAKQVTNWATPNAHDGRRPGADMKSTQGANLNRDAVAWPTPTAQDSEQSGSDKAGHRTLYCATKNYSPLVQPIQSGQESLSDTQNLRRHLNPLFAAWLMGWPSTWVITEPSASSASETALFQRNVQSLLSSLFDEQEYLQEKERINETR